MAQLRCSSLSPAGNLNHHFSDRGFRLPAITSATPIPSSPGINSHLSLSLHQTAGFTARASSTAENLSGFDSFPAKIDVSGGGGTGNRSSGGGAGGGGGSGGGSNWESSGDSDEQFSGKSSGYWILRFFLQGWRSRVLADPQFPFKVLMEELIGVSACVLGDMASRPNFGLNELDFVFSTLVVGSILNFVLMYLLAPTNLASGSQNLPAIFANCPKSHMFESGAYSVVDRFGTFVYKGTQFAAVGLAAGLVGTALSNGLIKMRKKMDPNFETPNKSPPTLLNALTWAIHMGFSSNLRYQTLNGIEFLLAKGLPPVGFKASVIVLRALNNVLGGVSFVYLARLTGSQKVEEAPLLIEEKEKLVNPDEDFQNSEPHCK